MNVFVKNICLAAGAVLTLVIVASIFLGVITQHGKEIDVPDFSQLSVEEAQLQANRAGVRVDVTDSVFVKGQKRGTVFTQNPQAGTKVKKGRRVILTINAHQAKQVTVPDLVGLSMRQAKAELASRGLELGRLIYVSDIATNNVLKQLRNNLEVLPGTQVDGGSVIDLVLGLSFEDAQTIAPDVLRLRYKRAVDAVQYSSMNVRAVIFDKSVNNWADSVAAVVYRQSPEATGMPVSKGAEMTLYLTVDESKIPAIQTDGGGI